MELIINADDFGLTPGVTEGIIYAHLNGVVSSTTIFMNSPYLEDAVRKVKGFPNLGLGVHLNLTSGKPLTMGKSICDKDGYFFQRNNLIFKNLNLDEVYTEWKAQIEKFQRCFGKKPTHIDSHHSVHDNPQIIEITKKIMKEYNLPARRLGKYKFIPEFYGDNVSVKNLIEILEDNKNNGIEIMTHCGYSDQKLRKISSYNNERLQELFVLSDYEVISYIRQNNIKLLTY